MDVVECYPWDGTSVKHKRRDKKKGHHLGKVVRTEKGPVIECGPLFLLFLHYPSWPLIQKIFYVLRMMFYCMCCFLNHRRLSLGDDVWQTISSGWVGFPATAVSLVDDVLPKLYIIDVLVFPTTAVPLVHDVFVIFL